jgi:hypothetical protein
MQSIDFAIEIFVDPYKKQHFFNRIFDNEVALNYVALYRNFGLQISDMMNKVFFHSIYKEFIDSNNKEFQRENWFVTSDPIVYGEFIEYNDK